jgi:hypothetical protein
MIQTYPCISAKKFGAVMADWGARARLSPDQSPPQKRGLPAWQVVNEVAMITIGYIDVNSGACQKIFIILLWCATWRLLLIIGVKK